ncbi:MAG: polyhydroxyalkanoic acid system family protein [Planctomycetaceae bacterium]|jgi:hypothetical protein|nr:polyhydroxyalkanoic acid system family protein [Planctomycetaceae bacterium]
MPKISVTEFHNLSLSEAVSRIKTNLTAALQANSSLVSDFSEVWTDEQTLEFAFKVFGFAINGTVLTSPENVTANANIPLAAAMMKGTIESKMREELQKILQS